MFRMVLPIGLRDLGGSKLKSPKFSVMVEVIELVLDLMDLPSSDPFWDGVGVLR